MIGTIRKHSSWMWAIIITGTIISFVYFFSPDARYHLIGRGGKTGWHIYNQPVTVPDYQDAIKEAKLRYYLRYGTFPDDKDDAMARQNFVVENEANFRVLMIDKLRTMGVQVGADSTRQFRDELMGHPANPVAALNNFNEKVLAKNGFTLGDFERFVRHEVGMMHLVSLGGLAGRLVTPQEAEQIYRRENEEIAAEVVHFSASNYLAKVTNLTQEALTQMYTNRMPFYQIPERLQVSYVRFELTNFMAQAQEAMAKVTNLTAQIDAIYRQQPTNFWKDKQDQPLTEVAAKEKIQKEMLENEARRLSYKKSYEFMNGFSPENGFNPDKVLQLSDLEALAARSNLTVHVSAPFSQEDPPADMKVPDKFVELAFRMTNSEPVSLNPIPGEDGTYVFALKQRLPRETPPFEAVKEKVIKDYKEQQANEQAQLEGKIFYDSLTNGLAKKLPFTQVCLEAKQTPIPLPAFSRQTSTVSNLPPAISLNEIKRLAFGLSPGEASPLTRGSDGYLVVFLRSRFPADEEKVKKELPAFLANLRMARQGEAANEWFNRQNQVAMNASVLPKPASERNAEPGTPPVRRKK